MRWNPPYGAGVVVSSLMGNNMPVGPDTNVYTSWHALATMVTPVEVPPEPAWDGTYRGPVTPDEALAVHQRSCAIGISRRRPKPDGVIEAPPPWPTEAPSADDQRQMAAFRLDPEALAYARARAALEGMPLSTVLDRLLRAWASYPPGWWPTEWEELSADEPWEDAELPGRPPRAPRRWRTD